jgi:hypothetical protein
MASNVKNETLGLSSGGNADCRVLKGYGNSIAESQVLDV